MTLEDFGFNAKLLVAGFSGGVIHALVFKQREPGTVVASVLTGTLTANYLTPLVTHYAGAWIGDGLAGFVVGLTGMALCQGVVGIVTAKIKNGDRDKPAKETPP